MEKKIKDTEELQVVARELLSSLTPQETATLITLSGELGAGKTTFTQALARELGVTESVTSPTFVLEKIYDLANQPFKKLIHLDAYRLTGGKDLAPLNFEELLEEPMNLIVLEWPERVADALPTPTLAVLLTPHSDGSRTLLYTHG